MGAPLGSEDHVLSRIDHFFPEASACSGVRLGRGDDCAVLDGDGLLLRQEETPGVPYVCGKLCAAAQSPLYKPLLLVATGGAEEDFLRYKALQILSPELGFHPDF